MNLFKTKFSIRKFTVGTFSTVIATLSFITHTGHALNWMSKVNLLNKGY